MSAYAVNWEAKNYSDIAVSAVYSLLLILAKVGRNVPIRLKKMGLDVNEVFNSAK